MTDYSTKLRAAETAARAAGAFLRRSFHSEKVVDASLAHDVKLRLDKEAQELIAQHLLASFPQDSLLGEEGVGGCEGAADQWVVDPLDGTVNYFYGIPIFCVSIALQARGQLVLGCVYDPMQDECFTAQRGKGAYLNGKRIQVSSRAGMQEAIVFIGHGSHDGSGENGIRRFARISSQVRKIRILGSAALTISYIAAGRLDAYIENRINLWDFAAARVLLEEAGGRLEFSPSENSGVTGSVIAWNGLLPLHESLNG